MGVDGRAAERAPGHRLAELYAAAVVARREAGHLAADEAIAADGTPRQGALWEHLEGLGLRGLLASQRELGRLARDEGVAHGVPARWHVDPIPMVFDADEWATLQAGIAQRARLLDAILTDLYGERRLIRDRLLPAELFLGHDGYLLPAVGVTIPGPRQLPVAAVDLSRGPDGWQVITERTQAPAGIGYALANRRLVTRVMDPLFRTTRSHRLRGFFDVLQHALHQAAPAGVTNPRIVLLTPGAESETSYDQALVATLLGHPVVESDDLEVREGRVWLRTPGSSQRVHVVQRRVDGDWTDPLDLRPESRLGVAGLLAAARRGTVSVVNPIGSGVLENVGMVPYLERVAREVLGEELLLGSPMTWWCGDAAARSHVLANLEHLTIVPTSRTFQPTTINGWDLDAAAREDLARRIAAEPWAWAAQEWVEASTTPVVTPTGLSPRAMQLRAFRIAVDDDYVVMPGGLARVAASEDQSMLPGSGGVLTKDVWVLESPQTPWWPSLTAAETVPDGANAMPVLTPRAAGDLYWMGRYAERTEATARLVAVADNLAVDHSSRPGSAGHTALLTIMSAIGRITGGLAEPAGDVETTPSEQLLALLVDAGRPGSVAFAAQRTTQNALAVRELLSLQTVGILGDLNDTLEEAADAEHADPQGVAAAVVHSCLALSGIASESLIRDEIWTYLDAGRRLERAQGTVALLAHATTSPHSPVAEAVVVEMVLRACDTLVTYKRRMAAGVGSNVPAVAAVELLLEDAANPRSVHYQLDQLVDAFNDEDGAAIRGTVSSARALLHGLDHDALFADQRAGLATLLSDLEGRLWDLSRAIERTRFAPQRPSHSFSVLERQPGWEQV